MSSCLIFIYDLLLYYLIYLFIILMNEDLQHFKERKGNILEVMYFKNVYNCRENIAILYCN